MLSLTFAVCPAGTYRSLIDDQGACFDCPMNTAMDVEGAPICSCLNGFFRDEQTNEGPEVDCISELNLQINIYIIMHVIIVNTAPCGPVINLRATTITMHHTCCPLMDKT